MDRQSIITYKESFDAIATYITGDDGNDQVEVWFARDLQSVLGYARWENFQTAIGRAVDSCKSLNVNVDDHFREVTKMIHCPYIFRVASADKKLEKVTQKLPKNEQ